MLIQLNFLIPIIFSFKCGFNSLPRPKIQSILPINNTSNQNLRTLSSYHPLKIYVDYEPIENSLLEETLNSIKSAFDLSLSIFQQLLSISNNENILLRHIKLIQHILLLLQTKYLIY